MSNPVDDYQQLLESVFNRHPSVGSAGFSPDAYKPGLDNMRRFDAALGSPAGRLRCVHVAGTNGKGSVSSMIASSLAADGLSVGLYTSPHLLDFRERARIVRDDGHRLIPREYVHAFLRDYMPAFDSLVLSFFEITTGLAFRWFADCGVDIAVIETGLGGRLDSTNIIVPELSVISSIGLDHCALLGDTLQKIAAEKAGIFKPGVPALVWARDEATAPVFERAASDTGCRLFFADDEVFEDGQTASTYSAWHGVSGLDLRGEYQTVNLRTACAALQILGHDPHSEALGATARRTGFRGRWELLRRSPDVICDIGHNPQALRSNFAQLEHLLHEGTYRDLYIVFGAMADKDFTSVIPLFPPRSHILFATPATPRARSATALLEEFLSSRAMTSHSPLGADDAFYAVEVGQDALTAGSITEAVRTALSRAGEDDLVFIGGSNYVVAEALQYF